MPKKQQAPLTKEQEMRARNFLAAFVASLEMIGLAPESALLLAGIAGGTYCLATFDIPPNEEVARLLGEFVNIAIDVCYPQQAGSVPLQA